MISVIISACTSSISDSLCYEIPLLNPENKELVWAIIPVSLKEKVKKYDDLASLKEFTCGNSEYIVLCKSQKQFSIIFTKEVEILLENCGKSLKMLYVSSKISVVVNSNLLVRGTFAYDKKLTSRQIKFMQSTIERVLEQIGDKYELL